MLVTRENVLEQLNRIIERYGEANEDNEMSFECDVRELLEQIEEYDNYHLRKYQDSSKKHSEEAIDLIEEFVEQLETIPDGCAESFPFDLVDELKGEYGI